MHIHFITSHVLDKLYPENLGLIAWGLLNFKGVLDTLKKQNGHPPTSNFVWILIMPHIYQEGTKKVYFLYNNEAFGSSRASLVGHEGARKVNQLGVFIVIRSWTQAEGPHTQVVSCVVWIFHQCQRRVNVGFNSLHECSMKREGQSLKLSTISIKNTESGPIAKEFGRFKDWQHVAWNLFT